MIEGTMPKNRNQTTSFFSKSNIETPLNKAINPIVIAATKKTDLPYSVLSVSLLISDANIYVMAIQKPLTNEKIFPKK